MNDDTRILKRFNGYPDGIEFAAVEVKGTLRQGLVIDVETTGTDPQNDEIIELALVEFVYDDAGLIIYCHSGKSWFNEPEKEISPEITELTGITNDMVKGASLPAEVEKAILNCSLIIAHNAAFDRQFVERYFPSATKWPWACSMSEIDWAKLGAPGKSLQAVSWWHGFFFDGHRADIDCEAVIKLLAEKPALAGEPLFPTLLASARQRTTRVFANNAPFEFKDTLKARGYQWHDGSYGHAKAWFIDKTQDDAPAEVEWLKTNVSRCVPESKTFGATTRYSRRAFE